MSTPFHTYDTHYNNDKSVYFCLLGHVCFLNKSHFIQSSSHHPLPPDLPSVSSSDPFTGPAHYLEISFLFRFQYAVTQPSHSIPACLPHTELSLSYRFLPPTGRSLGTLWTLCWAPLSACPLAQPGALFTSHELAALAGLDPSGQGPYFTRILDNHTSLDALFSPTSTPWELSFSVHLS